MLENTRFGMLAGVRALRAGAVAALIAASIATGAGLAAASTPKSVLLIGQKQATADAAMRLAGVGPSLAGNSTPLGR